MVNDIPVSARMLVPAFPSRVDAGDYRMVIAATAHPRP
jgi:hypothetical protein